MRFSCHPRTLRIFAALLAGYVLLALPAYWGPSFLEPVSSKLVLVPLLSIHLFHKLGVPGLLEHDGFCGWGWCEPTALGWLFGALLWLGVFWLVARGVARLTTHAAPTGSA